MSNLQYQAVFNTLSFALASMMATTVYLWLRMRAVHDKFQSAVIISGLVTFIAAYHYFRIFNSWVEAYRFPLPLANGTILDPVLTGVPFNDAYRYMDWLLTVPLLLLEILLVMDLEDAKFRCKAWVLGLFSAAMIVSGYYGELVVTGNLAPRWNCWGLSMAFFLYIVYELIIGLSEATSRETPLVAGKIRTAQIMTVLSWCTYPVVYLFPMLNHGSASSTVVSIQLGYCVSDIISKCGVGLVIYQISKAKSEKGDALLG